MPAQPDDPQLVVDATSLKALTHPLRLRLLDQLESRGQATASQLGAALGESSGATSYHLRQLERHGFIQEVSGAGTARERVWRPAPGGWRLPGTELLADSATRRATDLVLHQMLDSAYQRARDFLVDVTTWPDDWQSSLRWAMAHLTLNPEQLTALNDELAAVIERHKALPPGPGARRVEVQTFAFPTGEPELPE